MVIKDTCLLQLIYNWQKNKAVNTFCTPSRETRLANPYVLYPKPRNTAR